MPRLLPAILIGVAVIFDILIAISLPLVPDLKLYIVGIDFSQTTFGSTLLLFNGQVNSAGKTFLVQNLVQLQVKFLFVFFFFGKNVTDKPDLFIYLFFLSNFHPFSWASGEGILALACKIEPLTKRTQGSVRQGQSR